MMSTSCTYEVKHTVASIEIYKLPNKIDYEFGERFNSEGAVIKVIWDDGYFSYETDFETSIPNGTILSTENTSVDIKYKGYKESFNLNISLPKDLCSVLSEEYQSLRYRRY